MLSNVCCFISSGEIPKNKRVLVISSIEMIVKDLINDGCNRFISPLCSGGDIICAKIISRMKLKYPSIILEAFIPCRSCIREDDEDFMLMMQECDVINIRHERFDQRLYNKSFRDMIDESDALIAIFDGDINGETYRNLKYAYERSKQIKVVEI